MFFKLNEIIKLKKRKYYFQTFEFFRRGDIVNILLVDKQNLVKCFPIKLTHINKKPR